MFSYGINVDDFLYGALGLTISLAVGFDNFDELLEVQNEMDEHFKTAEFDKNMPVVLALLFGIIILLREALIPYSVFTQTGLIYNKGRWRVTARVWVEMESGRLSNRNHYLGEPGPMRNMLFFS
jgi:hypothetical protein